MKKHASFIFTTILLTSVIITAVIQQEYSLAIVTFILLAIVGVLNPQVSKEERNLHDADHK